MKRLSDTPSFSTYASLDHRDAGQRQNSCSWKGTPSKFMGKRGFRRVLTILLLLIICASIFPLRAIRDFGPLVALPPKQIPVGVDWSQYAYCQYATNKDYLCNSVMIFEALDRVGSKASRVLMYPSNWDINANDYTGRLLRQTQARYNVQLSPVKIQRLAGDPTWADSFTKLLAFNQTQFKRVLSLDSDATVLQSMDELFFMPSAPVAMPSAYWRDNILSSQLILIEPSEVEFRRILEAFDTRSTRHFDMEIMNRLYGSDCIVLPHRTYNLLSGEFREKEHQRYLGSDKETWDPEKAMEEAKYVHFSDWPVPKPWKLKGSVQTKELRPECRITNAGEDCRDRDIWLDLYADFAKRRKLCDV